MCASLIYKDSIEVDEQRYPIHVSEQRLVPDSEGAGRQRGGLGSMTVYGPKKRPMSVAYSLEAQQNPSRGVRGGLASPPTEVWMLNAAGERVAVPPVAALELQPGERIVSVSAGGGGYGDPFTRDPAAVLHDVLEGWVSRERAREVYGVMLSESGEAVDVAATEARRAPPR